MRLFLQCLVLLLVGTGAARAATVRFAWTNYLGAPDTNWFRVYPVGDVAQSDGSFISKGPPTRLTPNASGLVTNTFEMGTYVASNSFLNRGIAFRVPNDHGPTVYCATCGTNNTPAGTGLAISGFNYFITLVYGTNPPPTYDEITNSLGFLPVTATQATNIANAAAANLAALTNNDTRSITFDADFTVTDQLTATGRIVNPGMTLDYASASAGVFYAADGVLFRSRNASILTNLNRSGVTGLEDSLTYLTNNIAGVTNNQVLTGTPTSTNANLIGTFTGNAAGLTNYGGPEVLLNPIRVGFGTQPYAFTIQPSSYFLAGAPGTAGLITKLEIQPDLSAGIHSYPNEWNDINLQIFPDCGSFTNNASLTNPAVNIPLADLFNNRFRYITNGHWAVERKSRFVDSQDWSTNLVYGGPIHLLWFYAPIYFSNGCVVRLQETIGNTNWPHGYIGATVDNRANLDQLGRFASWRLRSHNVNGAFTGGSASNYLTTVSTAGFLAGWTVSAFDNTEAGLVASWLDTRGLQVYTGSGERWTGFTDDLLGSTYAAAGGFGFGPESGVVNWWYGPNQDGASQAIEGYRWFGESGGMYWTNSAVFSLGGNAVFPSLVGYSSTILYYAP